MLCLMATVTLCHGCIGNAGKLLPLGESDSEMLVRRNGVIVKR